MKFKMKSKVWITSGQKLDGRYNKGVIVGIELFYYRLGYLTEKQYIDQHEHPKYKVAYVDCVTNKAESRWFSEDELSKEKIGD